MSWFWINCLCKWSPYHMNNRNFFVKYYQGFSSNGRFLPWQMMMTSFSHQAFQRDSWARWSFETNFVLHACLKWFKQSKTLRDPKHLKKRWWVLSKWSGGLEKKCVGGWVFTILKWQWSFGGLGIWMWFNSRLHVHVQHQHLSRLSKSTWCDHFVSKFMSTSILMLWHIY